QSQERWYLRRKDVLCVLTHQVCICVASSLSMVEKTQPSRQHKHRLFLTSLPVTVQLAYWFSEVWGATVALKGGDQTLRYSLDKSTAELLHLSLLPVRQISWVVFVLVAVWLLAVFVARRQYVATLKQNVSQHRLDVEHASAPIPRAGDR